jgi:AraC-like DNA-binding protein
MSVVDTDGYGSSVRGVGIRAIRIGSADQPNSVATVSDDHLTVTAVHVGFPINTWAETPDDTMIVARIRRAPRGSRWVGMSLHADQTLAYGPNVEHVGTNLAGTSFTFVTTEFDWLKRRADELRSPFAPIETGLVRDVTAIAEFDTVGLDAIAIGDLRSGTVPPWTLMDDALSDIALALASMTDRPARSRFRPNSSQIVHRCLEYARSVDRAPSVSELCLAADVSERTLRDAFVAMYDTPPSIFFRQWALNRANDRLTSGDYIAGGVSEVALQAGFGHLGRFARYYRSVFGESPSDTYRRHASVRPHLVAPPRRRRAKRATGRR